MQGSCSSACPSLRMPDTQQTPLHASTHSRLDGNSQEAGIVPVNKLLSRVNKTIDDGISKSGGKVPVNKLVPTLKYIVVLGNRNAGIVPATG